MTDPKLPYLSLAMIVGDAGVSTLPRLLTSVLNRSAGPMVDEIVICWNGADDESWYAAMGPAPRLPSVAEGFIVSKLTKDAAGADIDVTVRVVRQKWPGRFDVARNESFRHTQGEWVIWLDSDDVVADAGKVGPDDLAAIENCERDYGIPPPAADAPPAPSLKQYLQGLPWDVNCVLTPYDYTIDHNNYVVIRQKMKRIVRRNANFIWWSPEQSGVHEVLYPLGNVAEKAVETFGCLVRHHPAVSDEDRAKRNREIIFELSKQPTASTIQTGRHQYDLANSFVTIGELDKADAAIKAAIANAQSPLDHYIYRLARATLCRMRNNPEGSLGEAFAAIGTMPELQEAYFVACEIFFLLGKWDSVVQFYKLAADKKPVLLSKDQPLHMFVQPRAQVAMALGNMGEPEQGMVYVHEALARFPKNELAREALSKLSESIERKKVNAAYLDLCAFLLDRGEGVAAFHLLDVPPVALRGIEAVPRYRALKERLPQRPVAPEDVHSFIERSSEQLIESAEMKDGKVEFVHHPLTKAALYDVAFYCPHAMEHWWPRSLDQKGLGGSESSVVYLARELFKLGVRVTTYTPHGQGPIIQDVKHGIIERDFQSFTPALAKQHDVLVSCRAPWLVRRGDMPKHVPIWVWHQDNGYGNPWTWSPEVDERIGLNLHVSTWAMTGLLDECYPKNARGTAPLSRHVVLGNGIIPGLDEDWPTERPMRVITASDPSRGLAALLDAWPHVRAAQPDAELHVYCGFRVSMALAQSQPGMPMFHLMRNLEIRLRTLSANPTSGITYHEWAMQSDVTAAMKQARVYCYPGGPMPEGYGVALVQARAAGCTVMAPKAGALPEVLSHEFTRWLGEKTPAALSDTDLASAIVKQLKDWEPQPGDLTQHLWPTVARRFLKLLDGR